MSTPPTRRSAALILVLASTALAACGGGHRLEDFQFSGRTVAVEAFPAPAPELRTGMSAPSEGDQSTLGTIVQAGSRIVREVEARRARARLDSAATRLDVAELTADRALERSARYLGANPVEDPAVADYVLEVDLRELGIAVGAEQASLFVAGEAILIDGRTGAEVWSTDVHAWDPITGRSVGGIIPGDVWTAGALSEITVAEFADILERLADFAGDQMSRALRDDLRDVRRDE